MQINSDANWIDGLRGRARIDLTLGEAEALQKMVAGGDLKHVDGAFIAALADLADKGEARLAGLVIRRDRSGFLLSDGGAVAFETDAIAALQMAELVAAGRAHLVEGAA